MSQPNKLPMWILKEKNCEDDFPYTFIYQMHKKLFMIEYVDKKGEIRSGPKTFMSYQQVGDSYFCGNNYEMIVYNPGQSQEKHSNFLMSLDQPNFSVIAPMVQSILNMQSLQNQDEDPTLPL